MKRFASTLLLYIAGIAVIWLMGWLLVSGWYIDSYEKSFMPILNYAALPALISALICILTETVLWRLSVIPALILVMMFALRFMITLVLSAIFYIAVISGPDTSKIDKIGYVLMVFLFYGSNLIVHVISNVIDNRLEEKLNK